MRKFSKDLLFIIIRELDKIYEPKFISDVYNNRKEKGIHKAMQKAQSYMNATYGGYYLQLDIKGFFDNYVKRVLKMKHYIRYVDDFVLFHNSKEKLQEIYTEIQNYLKQNLSLELRQDSKLEKHSQGLDFLGYIIRENYVLTRKRVVNNYKYKKAKYLQTYENQEEKMTLLEIKQFLSVKESFESHIKHSNSYNLKKKNRSDK